MALISIIVAIAENNAIGKNNDLLCHLPNDLKHFKSITSGKPVIMGRRTFYSLPIRPLKNRKNVIITDIQDEFFANCITTHTIEDAINAVVNDYEAFVIGGGMIYKQFLPIADRLYITHIHKDFDADVYFPTIDFSLWKLTDKTDFQADEKHKFPYTFATYERQKNV